MKSNIKPKPKVTVGYKKKSTMKISGIFANDLAVR